MIQKLHKCPSHPCAKGHSRRKMYRVFNSRRNLASVIRASYSRPTGTKSISRLLATVNGDYIVVDRRSSRRATFQFQHARPVTHGNPFHSTMWPEGKSRHSRRFPCSIYIRKWERLSNQTMCLWSCPVVLGLIMYIQSTSLDHWCSLRKLGWKDNLTRGMFNLLSRDLVQTVTAFEGFNKTSNQIGTHFN